MVILNIDTSTSCGSVAVTQKFQILSQKAISGPVPFSQILMQRVDDCLREAGVDISEISAFAVARGPGSFTGLRLGIAVTNGLALVTGRPSAGIETLQAMALLAPKTDRWICTLLDARKNEIYGALFRYQGDTLRRITEDAVGPLEDFLRQIPQETFFLGNGADIHRDKIKTLLKNKASFETMAPNCSVAAGVGHLAWMHFKNTSGQGGEAPILPLYIRRCEAEIKRIF